MSEKIVQLNEEVIKGQLRTPGQNYTMTVGSPTP